MTAPHRLRRLLGEPGSLRLRSIRTTALTTGATLAGRFLSLGSNLIMTRLLAPEAFGLMAMVFTVQFLVGMMSDIGIYQSIVRSRRDDAQFLSVAWTVQIIRGLFVTGAVVAVGGLLGMFGPRYAAPDSVYADPQLPVLVAVTSLTVLLRSFESTALALAVRNLTIGRMVKIELQSQVVTILIMVGLGLIWPSVWVLVIGALAGSAQRLIWSHLAYPEVKCRWVWDREIADEMWRFGRWMIVSSMAGFIVNQGDRLYLGGALDKSVFGLYVIALLFLEAATGVISTALSRVALSGLAEKAREQRDQLPVFLNRVWRLAAGISWVSAIALFVGGPIIIGLLYRADYHPAGWMLSLIALRLLTIPSQIATQVLTVMGHTRAIATAVVMTAVGTVTLLPLVFHLFGLPATLVFISLLPLLALPWQLRVIRKLYPDLPVAQDLWQAAAAITLGITLIATGLYDWYN